MKSESKLTSLLFVIGTRPEAIKLAPLIIEFQKEKDRFTTAVCVTAQHRTMLDQVLEAFSIVPDYDLNLMREDQSLFDISSRALQAFDEVFTEVQPDILFIQGDTTTTLMGAMAGYYKKIKIAHIEAGLRSGDKYSPYPEEINRILVGHIADYHFAPTQTAVSNLRKENIIHNVWEVGNTVIDAMNVVLDSIQNDENDRYLQFFKDIDFNHRILLATGHRRENFNEPLENVCKALEYLVEHIQDIEVVYPVHFNPNVRKTVFKILGEKERIHLIDPLGYPEMVWLMNQSTLILTDSGGIQEEAPSLGKPVLVMRNVTERNEGLEAGTARLVGTNREKIIESVTALLSDENEYRAMSAAVNPYGDGKSCLRIVGHIKELV